MMTTKLLQLILLCVAATTTLAQTTINGVIVSSVGNNGQQQQQQQQKPFIEKEVLYNLNPFDLVFSSTHHEFFATGEASPFDNIKSEIRIITGWYLEAFIDNLIGRTGLGFRQVSSVDLQVAYFRPERPGDERRLQQGQDDLEKEWGFRAEIYGVCKFLVNEFNAIPPRTQVERVLNQLVRDAFDQRGIGLYVDQMKASPDKVLANIVTLRVETDEVAAVDPPEGETETQEEEGGGGGGESSGSGGGSKWDTKAYVLCFLMAFFLIASLVCLYKFMSRRYHDHKANKNLMATDHYLDDMNHMLPHQNGAQESNRYLSPDRPSLDRRLLYSSDPKQNGSGSNENVVPVPAPVDRHQNLYDLGDENQTPRRYINPSSPLQILYGASFLHGSNAQQGSGGKQKRRRSSRKAPSANIRPMLSIAEEEHPGGRDSHYSVSPAAGVTSWIRQWTGYPDESLDKFQHDGAPLPSPTGVEEVGVFYRDFPRHDGTPCLIYNSAHGDSLEHGMEANDNDGSLKLDEVYIRDSSYHSTGSLLSLTSAQSARHFASENNDNDFVVKLEHLMEMRQKQYRERVQMEQEKAAYAKKRHEGRANTRRSMSLDIQQENNGPTTSSSAASVGAASVPHSSHDNSRGMTSHHDVERCLSPSTTTKATEATVSMDADSSRSGQSKKLISVSRIREEQGHVIT